MIQRIDDVSILNSAIRNILYPPTDFKTSSISIKKIYIYKHLRWFYFARCLLFDRWLIFFSPMPDLRPGISRYYCPRTSDFLYHLSLYPITLLLNGTSTATSCSLNETVARSLQFDEVNRWLRIMCVRSKRSILERSKQIKWFSGDCVSLKSIHQGILMNQTLSNRKDCDE